MLYEENKTYFSPGDLVQLKQNIPNKPVMLVKRIERSLIKQPTTKLLRGIRCCWFTENGFIQEAVFSTKDLQKV